MKKYEICKYNTEIRGAYPNGLSSSDIEEMLQYDSTPNFEWLESFDEESKARKYFETTYRGLASTVRRQSNVQYLYVTYYELIEMDYDEDGGGEGNPIARIIEPLQAEEVAD